MDLLIDRLKILLNLKDPDKDEDNEFRGLVETLQSAKYTCTNSNTEPMKNLLTAIEADDPTQAGPLFKPQLDWDLKKPDVTEVIVSEKSSELNRVANQESMIVFEKPIEGDAKQKIGTNDNEDKTLKDDWANKPKFVELIRAQMDLMRLLRSEYDNFLPAPPVHQREKFGKEGGTNFNLGRFNVPSWLMDSLETNSLGRLNFREPLSAKNYVNRFQCLLWLEEAHQMIQMRRYDMSNVLLAKYENSSYLIDVPGLAEGRPSLMRGDKALLKSTHRNSYYEAHIVEVRQNDIIIRAHDSFSGNTRDGLFFDVHFISSRTPFRRCHHGVTLFNRSSFIQSVVFPVTRISLNPPVININENPSNFKCFMRDLNIHQRRAVINVLENKCRPVPYIIFGPPGTGKTVTLVEAIFQIYARKPGSKVLVCANSNASADLIAKRVYERKLIKEDELVRVSAFYRFDQNIIPADVKAISKEMDMISAGDFAKYRVVISTCIQSGTFYEFGDRFDFVLIDEAGHANEAEALISLGLMKPTGACVLAGDPHQLGPVCVSEVAKRHGLGLSLLERIFTRECYAKRANDALEDETISTYDNHFITKLITSYRCDPRLMVVNNKHFYDNELRFTVETPKKWLQVVKARSPLIFHEVKGRDRREYLNPSWFNANEAIKCMIYVNSLYRAGLEPSQLGIITPYRRQIDKLKTLFESLNLPLCKIATMEEFQGDEREVIIISTVRTRPKNLEYDKEFNLGFLFDPKRFNVGISRAKWLVIVVGNSEILKRNPLWVKYMLIAYKPEPIFISEETENDQTHERKEGPEK